MRGNKGHTGMIDQSALRGMQVSCFRAMVGAQAVRRDVRKVCAGRIQCAGTAQGLRRHCAGGAQDVRRALSRSLRTQSAHPKKICTAMFVGGGFNTMKEQNGISLVSSGRAGWAIQKVRRIATLRA